MVDETDRLGRALRRYHRGFAAGDAEAIRASIGPTYFMASGNFSDDPTDWQAHLFLAGEDIGEWIEFMLDEAGPHSNSFETLHSHIRGEAALVVTSDTGGNRFRSWESEVTVWHLARLDGDWRIVGYFVKDLANPE